MPDLKQGKENHFFFWFERGSGFEGLGGTHNFTERTRLRYWPKVCLMISQNSSFQTGISPVCLVEFRLSQSPSHISACSGAFGTLKLARAIGARTRYIWFISGVSALFSFLLCLYILPLRKILASRDLLQV